MCTWVRVVSLMQFCRHSDSLNLKHNVCPYCRLRKRWHFNRRQWCYKYVSRTMSVLSFTSTFNVWMPNTFLFPSTEKCDIIKFYNVCYVKAMQEFVINTKEESLLSPLPPYSKNVSSPRKISKNHSLYIQMYRSTECIQQSPGSTTVSFCSPLEVSHFYNNKKKKRILFPQWRKCNSDLNERSNTLEGEFVWPELHWYDSHESTSKLCSVVRSKSPPSDINNEMFWNFFTGFEIVTKSQAIALQSSQ